MIDAAIVGLGWWGKTLVESVQGSSDQIRFVAGATRAASEDTARFAHSHQMTLVDSFQAVLSDPCVKAIVLATPHSMHARQVMAAALFGTCRYQPIKGPVETWEAARLDVTQASLEAFAVAAQGGAPFPITHDEMVHGASVTEVGGKERRVRASRTRRVMPRLG
jgi:hypothetical protein